MNIEKLIEKTLAGKKIVEADSFVATQASMLKSFKIIAKENNSELVILPYGKDGIIFSSGYKDEIAILKIINDINVSVVFKEFKISSVIPISSDNFRVLMDHLDAIDKFITGINKAKDDLEKYSYKLKSSYK